MINRIYVASIITVFLSFIFIFPICLSCSLLTILFTASILFGIVTALWTNIMLSLPHKTIVGAEHLLKQTEIFRNKLMVRLQNVNKLKVTNIILFYFRENMTLLYFQNTLQYKFLKFLEKLLIVYCINYWILSFVIIF